MNALKMLTNVRHCYNISCKSFATTIDKKLIKQKNVAVVLSGCGIFDGSEVTEAASVMIHLSRNKAEASFFAPDIDQMTVVNHLNETIESERRNVLVESARITRGNIQALSKLVASDFDAMIIPGGLGVTQNLSDYYTKKSKLEINKDLRRIFWDFIIGLKPIGLVCISPIIGAKLLPYCELAVSNTEKWSLNMDVIKNYQLLDALTFKKNSDEIHVDKNYHIVTTPAFLNKEATCYEVFNGIGKLVDETLKLAK